MLIVETRASMIISDRRGMSYIPLRVLGIDRLGCRYGSSSGWESSFVSS